MNPQTTDRPTVLLTGGTDGIGRAAAREFLRRGWEVVVVGRNPQRCQDTVAQLRQDVPGAVVDALVADLSRMEEVVGVATAFERSHQRLDVLLLNANAITQTHKVTPDGFESNLAVGFVGRALLSLRLRPLLERTPNAMVLGVVGLNLDRLDLEAPAAAPGFSGMRALGWWQWAAQVFSREWNRRVPGVPSNTYMPGLVRTKILANEPQPMRLLVQVAQVFMGIPVERGGEELVTAVEDARQHQRRDVYYARTRMKGPRDLKERPGDGAELWTRTERWLARWLPAA